MNILNNAGHTALTIAAVKRNVALAKRLLKANCRINKTSGMRQNALTCHLHHCQPVNRKLSRLLFAAGEILEDHDFKETMQDILQLTDVKMHLKHICRETIRRHLLELDPHQHLFGRIPERGLPEIVKKLDELDRITQA